MTAVKQASTSFRVRYGETDQMGLAYHPNYLVWCEIGRTELMRQLGAPYAALEAEGHFLAVAEATVRYGAAAHYDDLIRVDTSVKTVRSRAITFEYEIHRVEPEPDHLAHAATTLVCIDRDGRPRRLPERVQQLFAP